MGFYHYHRESEVRISKANLAALERQGGKSIESLINEQNYALHASYDSEGDIVDIHFDEVKSWNDGFYAEIAPFVEDGSFVEVRNDDGDVFRLMYRNGKMYRVFPKWEIEE